jgi:restriction system protein
MTGRKSLARRVLSIVCAVAAGIILGTGAILLLATAGFLGLGALIAPDTPALRHGALIGGVLLGAVGLAALWTTWALWTRGQSRVSARRLVAWPTTLDEFLSLSPLEFEHAVAAVLLGNGWLDAEVVGGSGDNAADILGRDQFGRLVAVQCKRFQPGSPVGSPDVQKVMGTAFIHHGAQLAMVVTPSHFTANACQLAHGHPSGRAVVLIDGEMLVELASKAQHGAEVIGS